MSGWPSEMVNRGENETNDTQALSNIVLAESREVVGVCVLCVCVYVLVCVCV